MSESILIVVAIIIVYYISTKNSETIEKKLARVYDDDSDNCHGAERIKITMKDSPKARLFKEILENDGLVAGLSDVENGESYVHITEIVDGKAVGFVVMDYSDTIALEHVFNVKISHDGVFKITDGEYYESHNINDFIYKKILKIREYYDRKRKDSYCLNEVMLSIKNG